MNKKAFFKVSMKLIFWIFFQAPNKYDEMIEYCVNQIEEEKLKGEQ